MFRVFTTDDFDKDFQRLDKSEQLRVEKILDQLIEKGSDIGKPLSGLSFFREKKFDGKRLYFLVYEDLLAILVIATSDKKAQQTTINRILLDISRYQQYIINMLKSKL